MHSALNLNYEIKIFAGRANPVLGEEIASYLNLPLGRITLGNFTDGEISARIEEDVRGRDVFLIQSTCPPVNDNLMELLIMIDCFRRASAARIAVVLPYYGYARQDRKDVGRVPITAKLVANLLTKAGADRVLALDLHAAQIQGFFDIPVDHLYATPVFVKYIRGLGLSMQDVVIVSPDEGRIKTTLHYQKRLGGELAIVDKRRASATETKQANLIGASLEGKIALMFDDMISTGSSIVGAAHIAKKNGAREVHVFVTHPILCGPAVERLRDAPISRLVVTNSIPVPPHKQLPSMKVLSVAPLLGEAIRRLHSNESVSKLFEG
jgi:ribose-phosphate pyrophosphokinase